MKNNIKGFLVILVCLFLFPLAVKADMGAPEVTSYDIRITNVKGASLYGFNGDVEGTIPYDTKVTVYFEYEEKGKLYGSIEYNGKNYEIDLADAEVFNKNVDLSKFNKLSTPKKLYVYGDDCYMFNGPSKAYGKVDGNIKIPVGETIQYEYNDSIWAYVEYNGVKGWIINYPHMSVYNDIKNSVAEVAEDDSTIYMVKNVKSLYKSPNSKEEIKVDIPAGEEVKYDYYVHVIKSTLVHITYKDKDGWVYAYDGFYGDDEGSGALSYQCGSLYVGDKNGIYVYKNARDINSKTTKKFEKGTILDMKYSFIYDGYTWYMVSEDGQDYWVAEKYDYDNDTDNLTNYGWSSTVKLIGNATMYKENDTSSEVLESNIKDGTSLVVIFVKYNNSNSQMIYTEYNGKFGWVDAKDYRYEESVYTCTKKPRDPEINVNDDKNDDKEDKDNEKKSMSVKQIALIAIGGAVVLALVIIVIIKIVNKKKVNNN